MTGAEPPSQDNWPRNGALLKGKLVVAGSKRWLEVRITTGGTTFNIGSRLFQQLDPSFRLTARVHPGRCASESDPSLFSPSWDLCLMASMSSSWFSLSFSPTGEVSFFFCVCNPSNLIAGHDDWRCVPCAVCRVPVAGNGDQEPWC